MQGPIAQAAALVVQGNRRLAGATNRDFWPGASVFKFCKTVRFVTLASERELAFADDPAAWIEGLRGAGVQSLSLHHLPGTHPLMTDRLSVGFAGGGGRWLIEALSGDRADPRADFWEARWSVGDRKDPERRIWNVTYGRVEAGGEPFVDEERSLAAIKADLAPALSHAAGFADRKSLEGFAAAFREAGNALAAPAPLAGLFHADVAPGLVVEAQQLFAAAERGWVFGGMGSWNDVGFPGQEGKEYEALSDRLFDLMLEAISAAANSSAHGRVGVRVA